jgi:hypothetical protein
MALIQSVSFRVLALSVLATLSLATVAEAQISSRMCSGDRLSKMMTMVGGMPDGPHKWAMYKYLAILNTAMSKDGFRGCEMTMKNMYRLHHMPHIDMHHMGN